MCHTEDAPTFERFLHTKFAEQRVNLVNGRKEFFFVSADEVLEEMKNYEGNYELNEIAA
ncbi:TPA: GIY-YIG nuclease family protein [Vibrio vulnificus]